MSDPRIEIVSRYRPIKELLPAEWTEGYVEANGIPHHYYRTGGNKPPVLLLHGLHEGALSWLRTARVLAADYDLIMPDARAHGLTGHVSKDWLAYLPADAAGIIDALGIGPAHVVGFSMGGSIGLLLADRYPGLVRSLVVAGWSDPSDAPAGGGDFTKSESYMAWFRSYLAWLEALKTQTHAERMVAALAQTMPGALLSPEDEYVAWVENCALLDLEMIQDSLNLWSSPGASAGNPVEALGRMTRPALLIKSGGWPTPGAEVRVQEEPSEQPNVQVVRFVNAGHLVIRDQFAEFVQQVTGFISTH